MKKKIFLEEHRHVARSYSKLRNVFQDPGQCNEAKEYGEKALIIKKKRYSGRSMVMSQEVITTWETFIKILDSTIKQKGFSSKHYDTSSSSKRTTRSNPNKCLQQKRTKNPSCCINKPLIMPQIICSLALYRQVYLVISANG